MNQPITIQLDDATARAIAERYSGHALTPTAIAQLGLQFMAVAPGPVVAYVKGIQGGIGDMWADYANHIRAEYNGSPSRKTEIKLVESILELAARRA